MIEIKLSQGAKPGKGGLLPKEKITDEIAELRGVSKDKDVLSPPFHPECVGPENTVKFIGRVQKLTGLPVGIKLCLGRPQQFEELIVEMKSASTFPDWITVVGSEGGTGLHPGPSMRKQYLSYRNHYTRPRTPKGHRYRY